MKFTDYITKAFPGFEKHSSFKYGNVELTVWGKSKIFPKAIK